MLPEQPVDGLAQLGRIEAALLLADVAALLDHVDGGRVGGWAADAPLLHLLDQGRLRVAGRRLGEVLLGAHVPADQPVAGLQGGELAVPVALLVALPDPLEAVEDEHRPGGAEDEVGGRDGDPGVEEAGRGHLAGHEPPPDQLVQPRLLPRQQLGHLLGGAGDVRRPDRLVGILDVLTRALTGLAGPGVLMPQRLADVGGGLRPRLVADPRRVGAHVGDQTYGARAAHLRALVQLLGDRHRPAGREAEPGAGVLLQGARGVGEGC